VVERAQRSGEGLLRRREADKGWERNERRAILRITRMSKKGMSNSDSAARGREEGEGVGQRCWLRNNSRAVVVAV
jgi:hypothetical protein